MEASDIILLFNRHMKQRVFFVSSRVIKKGWLGFSACRVQVLNYYF